MSNSPVRDLPLTTFDNVAYGTTKHGDDDGYEDVDP